MSKIPDLKTLALRDTAFADLMQKRIYSILLVATRYDSFILEDDGRVDEQIYNEYNKYNDRQTKNNQCTGRSSVQYKLNIPHKYLLSGLLSCTLV